MRVVDLLRAVDGAALAGDVYAVRALVAAAVKQLEGEADEAERGAGALVKGNEAR